MAQKPLHPLIIYLIEDFQYRLHDSGPTRSPSNISLYERCFQRLRLPHMRCHLCSYLTVTGPNPAPAPLSKCVGCAPVDIHPISTGKLNKRYS